MQGRCRGFTEDLQEACIRMTPIKTLEDYYKEENLNRITYELWCDIHEDWHPVSAFRIRKGSAHGKMECRLLDNERRRNFFRSERKKEQMITKKRIEIEDPIQQLICSEW